MSDTTQQIAPGLYLPAGYTAYLGPATAESLAGNTIPGQQLYGGADISRASDANGVLHVACCARGPDGDFRFRVFRYLGAVAQEVPLQARASGRGEIAPDQYSGQMTWIAWEHDSFFTNVVPGAAPFPSAIPSPDAYMPCVPNCYSAAIDGQLIAGGRSLDMTSLFDTPPNARAYAVRLVVSSTPDVRGRLGTEQQPGQFTVNCQVTGLQAHAVGIVNAGPGGSLWLSVAPNGMSASCWLQVVGYWPGV